MNSMVVSRVKISFSVGIGLWWLVRWLFYRLLIVIDMLYISSMLLIVLVEKLVMFCRIEVRYVNDRKVLL